MNTNRCFNCMELLQQKNCQCPKCGYDNANEISIGYNLKPGTMLRERYFVGNMLGQGGFGITYIGFDAVLNIRVAIKEYYPRRHVTRNNTISNSLQWDVSDDALNAIEHGRESFLAEARRMAKIDNIPTIVRIRDTFSENDTAYIIMDYVEGVTLKNQIKDNSVMNISDTLKLLSPVIYDLAEVHEKGIIHRDISPDNIMIRADGSVALLDLGAASDMNTNNAVDAVIKKGYSPIEQYSKKGQIGTWTDVYALCGVIYYCITGRTVTDSLDRLSNDQVESEIMAMQGLSKKQKSALIHGLAIQPVNRTQSVPQLIKELNIKKHSFRDTIINTLKKYKFLVAACIAAVIAGIWLFAAKPWVVSVERLGQSNSNMWNGGMCATIQEQYFYYIGKNGSLNICRANESTGKFSLDNPKKIIDHAVYINLGEDKVYFAVQTDKDQEFEISGVKDLGVVTDIYSMNNDGSDLKKLYTGVSITYLQYAKLSNNGEYLYFIDLKNGIELVRFDLKRNSAKTLLKNDKLCWFNIYDKYIFYTRLNDNSDATILARADLNCRGEKILDDENNLNSGICEDGYLYICNDAAGLNSVSMYRFSLDGEYTNSYIENVNVSYYESDDYIDYSSIHFAVSNGDVYYTNSNDLSLHKYSIEGNGRDEVFIRGSAPESICFSYGDMLAYNYEPIDARFQMISGVFYLKTTGEVAAIALNGDWKKNVMMKADDYSVFGNTRIDRNKIERAIFVSTFSNMNGTAWDVSYKKDGSVMAWIIKNQNNSYDLYIGARGGVNGSISTYSLFYNFENLKEISFGNSYHTDGSISMDFMFSGCKKLQYVDADKLVTKNVTSMKYMFNNCSYLETLDVSKFDTSNVESMKYMFWNCESIKELDISGFDMSKVVDTEKMVKYTVLEGTQYDYDTTQEASSPAPAQ